jgi:hypothetical protein
VTIEYEEDERLTSVLIEATERHIQKFKEHNVQSRQ